MCFRILFFLSHYQNNISRHQTIIIKLANNNSVDLIKFSISRLEIYKSRLDIYIFKLKIYTSNLKIEFPFQPNQLSLSMLSTFLRLYHRNKTENLRRNDGIIKRRYMRQNRNCRCQFRIHISIFVIIQ